jgi:hypothetical protein
MRNRIFILQTKKSKKHDDTTYCIGVFKLGTPYMEFIMGETNNDKEYKRGDETSYIYSANYTQNLQYALDWLSKVE